MESLTDRYVQFIGKLDRKHCRMLLGLLTGNINRQYIMLQRLRKTKAPLCRKCGTEKETLVQVLCECPNARVEKDKDADLGFCSNGSRINKRLGRVGSWPLVIGLDS